MVRKFFEGGPAMTIGKDGAAPVNLSWPVLIGAVSALGLPAVGVMSWAITKASNADNAGVQIAELKAEVREGFKTMREQVAGLPTQAAQIKQIDERARDLVISLGKYGEKLTETDRMAYDAAQGMKQLVIRVDRIEERLNKPVPLRDTR